MKQYLRRSTTSKVFLGVMAALLLYALTGFALAPSLLERYLPRYAQEQLGSQVTIGGRAFQSVPAPSRGEGLPPGVPARPADSSASAASWSTSSCRACSAGPGRSPTSRSTGSTSTSRFSATEASISPHSWTAWSGRYTAVSSGERPPLRWLLQHAQLRDGKLTFSDLSGQTPLTTPGRADQPRGSEPRDAARPARPVRDLGGRAGRRHDHLARRRVAAPHGVRGRARGEGREARHGLGVRAGRASSCRARRKRRCRHALPLRVRDRQATLGLDDIRAQVSGLALRARGRR